MRGGSPKNKRQGQYWVRRNLDDQKRARAASRREEAALELDRKAQLKASAAEHKTHERLDRAHVAAKRRLALWEHFAKIQEELKRGLSIFSVDVGNGRYELAIEFENEQHHEDMTAAHTAYQEHANWLDDNPHSMSATALSKHIQNAKRLLTTVGRATSKKCRWSSQERSFTFGDLKLDFSADEPPADPVVKKIRPARKAPEPISASSEPVSASDNSTLQFLFLATGAYAACVAVVGFTSNWSSIGAAFGFGLAIFIILASLVIAVLQKSIWIAIIPMIVTIVAMDKCKAEIPTATAERDSQNSMDAWLNAH